MQKMTKEKLIAQLNEMAQRSNELRAEWMKLDDDIYDLVGEIIKERKCPCCKSTGTRGLFSYDCKGGSFAISCYNCGMQTPHTTRIDVALNFLDALEEGFTGSAEDLRTRDGCPLPESKKGESADNSEKG